MKKSFLKLSFLAFVLFFCYSCQNSTTNTDNAVVQDSVAITPSEITETSTTTKTTEETQSEEFAPIYNETIRSTTAQTTKGSKTIIYRSDGHSPSVVSEWIGVVSVPNDKKILEIWYWNTNGEQSIQLELLSQNLLDASTLEYKGKVNYPDLGDWDFSIVKDRFILDMGNDNIQEFTHDPDFK